MSRVSTTPNSTIMTEARAILSERWRQTAGFALVLLVITLVSGFLGAFGSLLDLLIKGPLEIGVAGVFLRVARGQAAFASQLFSGFDRFLTGLAAYLLMIVYVLLWSLLLILPGVLAMLSYSMVFYILADEPGIGARAALRKSRIMMFGNRWKYCCLICRFIGWLLLAVATFGIGLLWVIPYLATSTARFYLDVRDAPAVAVVPSLSADLTLDDE